MALTQVGLNTFKNYVRYPTNCSYTGYCIENQKVIIYNEGKKVKDSQKKVIDFIQEIDNIVVESGVKSAIYGPLIDKDGNVQGALQIVNRVKENEVFGKEWYEEFESIREVLGSAVYHASKIDNVMNMNWKMLGVMDKMDGLIVKSTNVLEGSSKNLEQYLSEAKGKER